MPLRLNADCAMNGEPRLLLDTNAIVALLQGHQGLLRRVQAASWVGISIVNQIEFLSFSGLSDADRKLFEAFAERVDVVGLNRTDRALLAEAASLRARRSVKLPDAIVMASANVHGAVLVTRDDQLLRMGIDSAPGCKVASF